MKMVKYLYYWHKHIQFIRAALIMLGGKLVTPMKANESIMLFRVPCRESNFSCTPAITTTTTFHLRSTPKQQQKQITISSAEIRPKWLTQYSVHFMILSRAYSRGSLYHSQLNYYTSIIYAIHTHTHTIFCFFLSLMDYLAGETSTKLKKMSSCWEEMWKLEACWK